MHKMISAVLLGALAGIGGPALAATTTAAAAATSASAVATTAISVRPAVCSDVQQFACDNMAGSGGQKISLDTSNGPATSTSGAIHTYAAKISVTIDGVVFAGTATAVGGVLAGRTVNYKYSAKNIARSDGKPGQLDLDNLALGITGISCGRGKVCFSGSGVHTDLSAGTLTLH